MSTMLTATAEVNAETTIWAMPRGRPETDRPKKVNVSARVDPELVTLFESIADVQDRTVSYFIEKAMEEYAKRHGQNLLKKPK